jgi:hypothetical protein
VSLTTVPHPAWRKDPFLVQVEVPNPMELEVSGSAILAVLNGATAFEYTAGRSLAKYGIHAVQADQWYSQPAWIAALRDIHSSIGHRTIFAIGRRMKSGSLPAGGEALHEFFAGLDAVHHAQHRRQGALMWDPSSGAMTEGIGHYRYTRIGDRHLEMVNEVPYPSRFDHGVLVGFAERIKPGARVEHDAIRPCRQEGGASCTFQITW